MAKTKKDQAAKKKSDKKTTDGKKPSKGSKKKGQKKSKQKKDKKAASNIVDGVPTDLVYVEDSSIHGKGMFAAKKIKKDLVLGPLLGRPTKKDGTYVLWLTAKKGFRVTNDYRFINHSSDPNCALTDTEVVTLKSIKPGEELTHHYGWEDE